MTENEAIGRLTLLWSRYKNATTADERKHAEALKLAIDALGVKDATSDEEEE